LNGGLNIYFYSYGNPFVYVDLFGSEVSGEWRKKPDIDIDWWFRRDNRRCTGRFFADCKFASIKYGSGVELFVSASATVDWAISCFDSDTCEAWEVSDSYYYGVDHNYRMANPVLCVALIRGAGLGKRMFHPGACGFATGTTVTYNLFAAIRHLLRPAYEYHKAMSSLTSDDMRMICISGRA